MEGGDDHEGDLHGEEHRDHHDQHHRRAVRVPLPPGVAAPTAQIKVSTECCLYYSQSISISILHENLSEYVSQLQVILCTLSEYFRNYRKIKMTPLNTIHYHPDNSVHKSGPTVTIVGSLDHFNQEMDLGRTGDV